MFRITPATTITDLLAAHPAAARVLIRRRMACVGCPMARFETIRGAASAYSIELVPLMRDIERVGRAGASRSGRPQLAVPDDARS